MTQAHTAGLLLAAGLGKRMGCQKLLMPWPPDSGTGQTTVIESAYDGLAPHCPCGMSIVTGADHESIAAMLGARPAQWVTGDSHAPMFHSVLCGLRQALADSSAQAVFVHPADHPVIEQRAVSRMLNELDLSGPSVAAVVIPTYHDRGGHPILLNRAACRFVVNHGTQIPDPPKGLRGVFDAMSGRITRLPCNDCPWARIDLDTASEYEQAYARRVAEQHQ
ncbi:MAG: NTP transferase domain-containing protein [Planctomycetes bacterium]|nr:NTP transferase domain-containing protein [Planctomycetota bacterium]